jgi:Tol biopolymer transport system component
MALPGYIPGPSDLAIAPDASRLAYVANVDGTRKIWLRQLGSLDARPIAGTDQASGLFWSPDGRSLAFTAGGVLQRVDVAGASSQAIVTSIAGLAGSWGRDGVILISAGAVNAGLAVIGRTTPSGGALIPVTQSDVRDGEPIHVFPRLLPDGKHFFYVGLGSGGRPTAHIGSLERASATSSLDLGNLTQALEYAAGFVLYGRDDTLTAQHFDADKLQPRGAAAIIAERAGEFSVVDDVLVYADATESGFTTITRQRGRQLAWVDRQGQPLGDLDTPEGSLFPVLSPDDSRVALEVPDATSGAGDVWTIDIARGIKTRITFDPATDGTPIWSPDGTRIIFGSGRDGGTVVQNAIYQRAANGTGSDERLFSVPTGEIVAPLAWSADGSFVLFGRASLTNFRTKIAIWRLDLTGERGVSLVLDEPFVHAAAQLSPDGRWLAYSTNESGSTQIVVQSFPDLSRDKRTVSTRGGYEPRWRADGRELFYLSPTGTLMSVAVSPGDALEPSKPTELFDTGIAVEAAIAGRRPDQFYAVASNGERFLLNRTLSDKPLDAKGDTAPPTVHVIVNWASGLPQQ